MSEVMTKITQHNTGVGPSGSQLVAVVPAHVRNDGTIVES